MAVTRNICHGRKLSQLIQIIIFKSFIIIANFVTEEPKQMRIKSTIFEIHLQNCESKLIKIQTIVSKLKKSFIIIVKFVTKKSEQKLIQNIIFKIM